MSVLSLLLATPLAAYAADRPVVSSLRAKAEAKAKEIAEWSSRVGLQAETTEDLESLTVTRKESGETLSLEREGLSVLLRASVDSLPEEASAILSLWDETGAELARYQGSLDATQGLVLEPVTTSGGDEDESDCPVRGGCSEEGGRDETSTSDLSLGGAVIFEDGDGYALALKLGGFDLEGLAGASLTLLETSEGEEACLRWSEDGTCIRYGREEVVTVTEIDLSEDLELLHVWSTGYDTSLSDWYEKLVVEARYADGRVVRERYRGADLWQDEGTGDSAIPTDDDPYTSVAFVQQGGEEGNYGVPEGFFAIVSTGWTADALPEQAVVTLDGGETWTLPVHSYQRTFQVATGEDFDPLEEYEVWIDGEAIEIVGSFGARGVCSWNRCVALSQDEEGAWYLSVTALETQASDLPESVEVELRTRPSDPETAARSYVWDTGGGEAEMEEWNVVFGIGVRLGAPPLDGEGIQGKLRLEGPANKKGKRKTLLRDGFRGVLGLDDEGQVVLAPASNRTEICKGDILIGGEPIGIERKTTPEGKDISEPPVIVIFKANGKGTRNVASDATTVPQLL